MAIIASLDGRDTADTSVFRDTVIVDQETTLEKITVPKGKAVTVVEGLQQLSVTNDLVMVCCDFFANVLTTMRRQPGMNYTKNQVRVEWTAFPTLTVREAVSRLQYPIDSMVRDFAMVNQVIKVCERATALVANKLANVMFVPQGTLGQADSDLVIDDIIEKRNDKEVYIPNMISTIVQPMLFLKERWGLTIWDVRTRIERCLIFDCESVSPKTRDEIEARMKALRQDIYNLCDLHNLNNLNKRQEMAMPWNTLVVVVPTDELAPVSKGLAMQKLYALMYDTAVNQRDGSYVAMDAPKIYADKRNVSRMIRTLQGAIITDTQGKPLLRVDKGIFQRKRLYSDHEIAQHLKSDNGQGQLTGLKRQSPTKTEMLQMKMSESKK